VFSQTDDPVRGCSTEISRFGVEKVTLLANFQRNRVAVVDGKLRSADIVTRLGFFSTVRYFICKLVEKSQRLQLLNFWEVSVQDQSAGVKWISRNYSDNRQNLSWQTLVKGWSDKLLAGCSFRNSKPGRLPVFSNAAPFSALFIKQSVGPCITK